MAKIIEAKAVISAEDKTGAVFDKIAKKIDQIAKTGKAAQAVDQVSKAIERARTQLEAIDKFNMARGGIPAMRERFREAEAAVTRAARAMREGGGNAQRLARDYERAQTAVSSASRALERQQSAALSSKRALEQLGIPINRIAAEQDRLRSSVERTNMALEKQHGRVSLMSRAASAAGHVASNAALFAGPGILHATKEGAKSGAEIQSRIVAMRAAGIPEADIQKAMGETAGFQAKYTNVSRADMLERFKELRSVLLHPDEAHHLLETTVRANAAMNAVDRSGHMAEGLGFGIKGAELLGRAQDPKRFAAYLDSFIKAQQVMGKTITPEQQFELAKYLGASGATLSDRFLNTTGLSLAQEMQSRAGVGLDQLIKQVVGGFQGSQHAAAKEFVNLGLADKGDFETTKTGSIKGLKPGRHIKDWRLAMTDPDQYIYEKVIPAMERAGITSTEDQVAYARRLFTSGRAADVVAKLIQQKQSFANHAKLYGAAQGLNAIGTNQGDPFVALNSLTTSLSNFAGTLTSPAMEGAAGALSSMSSAIGGWAASLADWQKNNPMTAKVAGAGAMAAGVGLGGVLTYNLVSGLMSGFGLSASAAALDGSAAALTSAAAALGGGGVAGKAAMGAAAGSSLLGSLALPAAIGATLAVPAWSAYSAYRLNQANPKATPAGIYGGDGDMAWAANFAEAMNGGRDYTLGSSRSFGRGIPNSFIPSRASPFPGGASSGGFSYRDAGIHVEANGQVQGEATLNVKLAETSEFVRLITEAKSIVRLAGTIRSNGPGSAGLSSPDAGAASAGQAIGP